MMKRSKVKNFQVEDHSRDRAPITGCLPLFYLKRGSPFILLFVLILSIFLVWPVKGLGISTEDNLLFFFPKQEPYEFAIIYDHSVMRTEVKDVFTLEDGEILLLRTEYESFGAGLPSEAFESFEKVDGRYINDGINQRLPEIRMRTGKTADHRLLFNENQEIYFNDFLVPGSLIVFEEKTMTTLESLFY